MTTIAPLQFLLLTMAGWVNQQQQDVIDYLKEENRILRARLGKKRIRFTDVERRRLAAKGKRLGRRLLGALPCLVTPDTILRWYRQLVAKKYDGSKNRRSGRPRKPQETSNLVVKMATENPGWGYTRIRDALRNVGICIGRTTVQVILRDHGIEPAPERRKRTCWRTFLRAHWGVIAATDLFTAQP